MDEQLDLVDIVVVGGGAAGVAAATVAARKGHSVVLLERSGQAGGNAVNAAVGTICGLAPVGQNSIALDGFAHEFAGELIKEQARFGESSVGTELTLSSKGLAFLPYRVPYFLKVSEKLLVAAKVLPRYFSMPVAVTFLKNGRVSITVHNGVTSTTVSSAAVIDCSGDAVVSKLAGLGVYQPQRQCDALIGQVSGSIFSQVDGSDKSDAMAKERMLSCFFGKEMQRLCSDGLITSSDLFGNIIREKASESQSRAGYSGAHAIPGLSLVPGSLRDGRCLLKLGAAAVSSTEEARRVQSLSLRDSFFSLVQDLRVNVPECRDITVDWLAPNVGERTGACGLGRSTLTGAHVREGRQLPDEVVKGFWPIEMWESQPLTSGNKASTERMVSRVTRSQQPNVELINGGSYSISADMLISSQQSNLFFAGRTISADDEGISSARVLGTAMASGEAAAVLASEYVTRSIRHYSIQHGA
jgi:hypothetical protein